jgi:hypothetical protein
MRNSDWLTLTTFLYNRSYEIRDFVGPEIFPDERWGDYNSGKLNLGGPEIEGR